MQTGAMNFTNTVENLAIGPTKLWASYKAKLVIKRDQSTQNLYSSLEKSNDLCWHVDWEIGVEVRTSKQ